MGEVGDKGLAQVSRTTAVRGWDGVIDVVGADGAVVTVPVKQERLCKTDVSPAVGLQPTDLIRGAEGGQRLVQALRIHVIAQDQEKRRGPAEFHSPGINPGERLPAQWPLAIEDRLALDRPVDDLARCAPFVAAVTEQVRPARSAVGGVWPVEPL